MASTLASTSSVNHICNENTCKGRSSNQVSCFQCSERFFMKFFGIVDMSIQTKLKSVDSHIQFVCGKCLAEGKPSKSQKPTTRRSSSGALSEDNNQMSQDIKMILDKLTSMSNTQNNKTSAMNDPNPSDMNTQKYTMEKIDQIQASLDQIHQISITNSTKIDALPNANQFKDATANICKSVDNKLKEISNAINRDNNESILLDNHVLDWMMRNDSLSLDCSGRPSIVVKQSIDDNIMDVLKNSEEATWKSIDSLRDLIADQNHLLVSIQNNFLNTAKTDSNPTLTESVHQTQSIDALKQAIENQHSTLMEIKQKMDAEAMLNERQSVISGNLAATKDGEKEAMTQNNRKTKSKVPEKPKTTQKRQSPTSLGGQLESESHSLNSSVYIVDSDDNNWTEVKRKRRLSNSSYQRNSFTKPRSIFWSKVEKTMDIRKATDYIISNGIAEISEFSITCLTKNESASYLSYKLDTTVNAGNKILAYRNCPNNSFVRNFNANKTKPKRLHADLAKRNRNFI